MEARFLDMECYPRKQHFDYFRTLPYPYTGVTVPVDVTELYAFCKRGGYSFYLSFLHAAALAANRVPAFRQRIRGDSIVEYDSCGTSHVELLENGTFCYCTLYHDGRPFSQYMAEAEARRAACREKGTLEEDENVEGLYFVTTLPWLSYTALVQPVAGGDESNPRISWGKFSRDVEGRLQMPVTVLAHHALVDGLQISEFYRNVAEEIQRISGTV